MPKTSGLDARPNGLSAFVLLALVLAAPARAAEAPPWDQHRLALEIDPTAARLTASDEITTRWRPRLDLRLRPGLEVSGLSCRSDGERVPLTARSEDGVHRVALPWRCRSEDDLAHVRLAYSGAIPVTEAGALIEAGAGVAPELSERARYRLEVTVPQGWTVASQGRAGEPAEPAPEGRARFSFSPDEPTRGVSLAAGPSVVTSRRLGDTLVSVDAATLDRDAARDVLDAAGDALERLAETLGPNPHAGLHVVESPFAGSAGVPSVILLGPDGVRAAADGGRELGRALARTWWDRHLASGSQASSWADGLAAHVADELAAADQDGADALERRRRIAQPGAVRGDGAGDGPPAAEETALFFHQLRHALGDEQFTAGLRESVAGDPVAPATWDDLRAAFEKVSGRDLRATFSPWTNGHGPVRLTLESAAVSDGTLRVTVRQSSPPRELELELDVQSTDGTTTTHSVALATETTSVEIPVEGPVASVELDPRWHVARELGPDELPPSLARTLSGFPPMLVVYPATQPRDPKEELKAAYRRVAESFVARFGGQAVASDQVVESEFSQWPVLVLGKPSENPLARRLQGAFAERGIDIAVRWAFRVGTRRWSGPRDALLASVEHPEAPGVTATILLAHEVAGLEPASRAALDHRWDSWVAFRDGRAIERDTTWPKERSTRLVLAELEPPAEPAERIMRDVRWLTDPTLDGRDAGTAGGLRASSGIADRFEELGLEPWAVRSYQQTFNFIVQDQQVQPMLFTETPGVPTIPATPATFWLPIPDSYRMPTGNVVLDDTLSMRPVRIELPNGLVLGGDVDEPKLEGLDLEGAAVVLVDRSAPAPRGDRIAAMRVEEERARSYLSVLPEIRRRNGDAAIIVLVNEPRPSFPPMTATPNLSSYLPSVQRAHELFGARGAARVTQTMQSRYPIPDEPVRLMFATKRLLDVLAERGIDEPGQRALHEHYTDLRMMLLTARIFERNVVGFTPGTRPLRDGVVVLSAHHDGVGALADGTITQGAVDNASGVAVLLEVARRLSREPPPLSVAIVSSGAEKWGQQGSRHLAENWPSTWPVRAVINVDSVGLRGTPLHVIGRAREPELAELLQQSALAMGIQLGPDVDAYADRFGSDHWTWAARGIPAVNLFQADYRKLEGDADRIELLDPDQLARLADAVELAIRQVAQPAAAP